METAIKRPRGTSDLLGKDEEVMEGLRSLFFKDAAKYGAYPIEVPMFEESRLFHRTAGESSDIVAKETFDLEKRGDKNYTLRPEFTASINRAVLENKLYASPDLPLKISYFGPVFRYDRPQAGRYRQFTQFGVEFLDTTVDIATSIDALLLSVRASQEAIGKEVSVKLNFLGSFASRENYKKALYDFFKPRIENMCDDCKRRLELNPLRILDCKVPEDQEIAKSAPKITDYLTADDKKEYETLIKAIDNLGLNYQVDDGLVRGLDYYTGLVWELYCPSIENLGAIGGGGKYAHLMEDIGGPKFEGVGFSLGVERIALCLSEEQKQRFYKSETVDVFIVDLKKDALALKLAEDLRSLGLKVSLPSYSKALGGAFKMADRLKAKFVILVDDEGYQVKDMASRTQVKMSYEDIINSFKSR